MDGQLVSWLVGWLIEFQEKKEGGVKFGATEEYERCERRYDVL